MSRHDAAAFELQGRRAIYLGFDVTLDYFQIKLPFPMMLRNAIAWFESQEDVLVTPSPLLDEKFPS